MLLQMIHHPGTMVFFFLIICFVVVGWVMYTVTLGIGAPLSLRKHICGLAKRIDNS